MNLDKLKEHITAAIKEVEKIPKDKKHNNLNISAKYLQFILEEIEQLQNVPKEGYYWARYKGGEREIVKVVKTKNYIYDATNDKYHYLGILRFWYDTTDNPSLFSDWEPIC